MFLPAIKCIFCIYKGYVIFLFCEIKLYKTINIAASFCYVDNSMHFLQFSVCFVVGFQSLSCLTVVKKFLLAR